MTTALSETSSTDSPTDVKDISLNHDGMKEKREVLSNIAKKLDKLEWENKSMMIPHEPIRNDMRLMTEIVTVEHFSPAQPWKATSFFDWYDRFFYPIVHHHHDIEEKLFFPWISERVELPSRLSEDHVGLMERLANIKNQRKKFQDLMEQKDNEANWNEAVSELNRSLVDLEKFMIEHLDEEEELVSPLLKKHFTSEEHDVIVGKILQSFRSDDCANMVPWIVDRMRLWGGEAEAQAFLNSMPLPPRLLYRFFWKSSYERENRGTLQDLRSDAIVNPQEANAFCMGKLFK